jgi:HK97 gp10 family phage protein
MPAHVEGLDKLLAQLDKLGPQADEAVSEIAETWADRVEGTAKTEVPIRTGNLESAIESRTTATSAEVGVWEADAYYVTFVELGTSSAPAQPFLGPAFEQHRGDVTGIAEEAVSRRMTG